MKQHLFEFQRLPPLKYLAARGGFFKQKKFTACSLPVYRYFTAGKGVGAVASEVF